MSPDCTQGPCERLSATVAGRLWTLERFADLDALWDGIGEDQDARQAFVEDERLPYWTELWPASLLLADWLAGLGSLLAGKRCLDLGCGLGLTALVAASQGALVAALDYEWPALVFAARNAVLNAVAGVAWLQMDWRAPGFKPGVFEAIWGGDILYERRFAQPVADLLCLALAPNGVAWLASPPRGVQDDFHAEMLSRGFVVTKVLTRAINSAIPSAAGTATAVTVDLWELRPGESERQSVG